MCYDCISIFSGESNKYDNSGVNNRCWWFYSQWWLEGATCYQARNDFLIQNADFCRRTLFAEIMEVKLWTVNWKPLLKKGQREKSSYGQMYLLAHQVNSQLLTGTIFVLIECRTDWLATRKTVLSRKFRHYDNRMVNLKKDKCNQIGELELSSLAEKRYKKKIIKKKW